MQILAEQQKLIQQLITNNEEQAEHQKLFKQFITKDKEIHE